MHQPSVLMLGSLSLDLLERDGHRREAFGGAVRYGGLAAVQEGLAVEALVHLPEAYHKQLLERHGEVDWHLLPAQTATRFENAESAKGKRVQRCTEQAPMLCAASFAQAAEAWGPWDWVHCGPLHPFDVEAAVLDQLRLQAKTISLDVQGLLRRIDKGGGVSLDADALPKPILEQWLHGVDWVKASQREWAAIHAMFGLDPQASCVRWGWEGLLLTKGQAGGTLFGPHRHWEWRAKGPVRDGLETGAGDVFVASFLSHFLYGKLGGTSPDNCGDTSPSAGPSTGLHAASQGSAFNAQMGGNPTALERRSPLAALQHAAGRAAALVASER